jgi:hypothetical protein
MYNIGVKNLRRIVPKASFSQLQWTSEVNAHSNERSAPLNAGWGQIGCGDWWSYLTQTAHSLLTLCITERTEIIQTCRDTKAITTRGPAWQLRRCQRRHTKKARYDHFAKSIGCRHSYDNCEWRSRPPTLMMPLESMNEHRRASDLSDILWQWVSRWGYLLTRHVPKHSSEGACGFCGRGSTRKP